MSACGEQQLSLRNKLIASSTFPVREAQTESETPAGQPLEDRAGSSTCAVVAAVCNIRRAGNTCERKINGLMDTSLMSPSSLTLLILWLGFNWNKKTAR
jgi:hypothetical protein